jgi:drug/metabolite transporter (DMT)-like permease
MTTGHSSRGVVTGLTAAVLFGASTPVAKLLVPAAGAFMLAGLLYLGAGLGLVLAAPFRRAGAEAPLRRSDLPVLAVVILSGGVAGPLLLVLGLARLPGTAAALLLNLETPFTITLAVLFLREHLSRREAFGAGAVIAGAAALTRAPGALVVDPLGASFVAAACAAWAVDNAMSQRLAVRDPVAVARAKTLAAGAINVALGLALHEEVPSAGHVIAALMTGSIGYGLSIVLHLLAVRSVGAARQAAFFGTAPFIGALLAVPLLGEHLPLAHVGAGVLMALGIAVVVRARHGHAHAHEALEHEHAHVHDEHHAHPHREHVTESHSHPHQHAPLVHDHPHLPDLHHRHGH